LDFFTSDVNQAGPGEAVESQIWQHFGASGEPIQPSTLIDRVLLTYDEKKPSSRVGEVFLLSYCHIYI